MERYSTLNGKQQSIVALTLAPDVVTTLQFASVVNTIGIIRDK
jgi:hypothetical protein